MSHPSLCCGICCRAGPAARHSTSFRFPRYLERLLQGQAMRSEGKKCRTGEFCDALLSWPHVAQVLAAEHLSMPFSPNQHVRLTLC